MKKLLIIISLLILYVFSFSQNIQSVFKEKWKTDIGVTTFRTNIIYDDFSDIIIVGSNGKSRALLGDNKDGVYLLNPKTGIIKTHLKSKSVTDSDVNGVAVSENYIYFGNDNSMFYCSNKSGKKVWEFIVRE